MKTRYLILLFSLFIISCDDEPKYERKGFTVNHSSPEEERIDNNRLQINTTEFDSRPNGILLTGNPKYRLIPTYKLNTRIKDDDTSYFTGSNNFYSGYSQYEELKEHNWNHNFMPGFQAMYGYNFINISIFNSDSNKTTELFKNPVLIKTLYYPTDSKDTLNNQLVQRNYYMISAYNEDSNKDGTINSDDLRRFFLFNIDGTLNTQLIPSNYSVNSSQYDPFNDYMYIYATLDENKDGQQDETEEVHVFWINLKSPKEGTRLY